MTTDKTTTVESLLGVLSIGPMSGYEMRQMMEQSTANFWSESFGQIYPSLKRMLAAGLVQMEDKPGARGPMRKVYRITAEGEDHLCKWLGLPARPQVYRHELLLKVFFGDRAEPGVIASQVTAWRERFVQDQARYSASVRKLEREHSRHPAMPYWRMTARYGIAEARMVIAWCDRTLTELTELETATHKKAGTRRKA
jgi:DNA-binding PadR family transcriptional regulator